MPLYEFSCRKCGHSFEELTTLAEVEKKKPACPACGSRATERGLSGFATGSGSGGSGSAPCGGGGFT
ncbi:MAG: zinc ribbon domain-containing protein [bacterium]|nr:zinc ribbon domain-containing protein [bacterium]